jgi:hypothetical protein
MPTETQWGLALGVVKCQSLQYFLALQSQVQIAEIDKASARNICKISSGIING